MPPVVLEWREEPLSVSYGMGIDEHDHEGRVITLEMPDFYLVCVYVPNSQDGLRRLDYRMCWEDDFRAYLCGLASRKGVVVCGDMNKAMEGPGRAFWVQDCSAATQNILLAAHALGLGAVWTGCYPVEERMANVSQVLKLPENLIPLCVIVTGYPNEQPAPKDKWKPENVTYNEFK